MDELKIGVSEFTPSHTIIGLENGFKPLSKNIEDYKVCNEKSPTENIKDTIVIVKFDIDKFKPEEIASWCNLYKKVTGFKIIPIPNNLDVNLYSTNKAIEFLEIKLEELKNNI